MTTTTTMTTTATEPLLENLRDLRSKHIEAANRLEGCLSSHNYVVCSKRVTSLTLERVTETRGRMVSTTNPTLWMPWAACDIVEHDPDLTAVFARDWHRDQIEHINYMIRTLWNEKAVHATV